MSKQFEALQPDQIAFIGQQHIFFTATSAPGSRVNLSPKGMNSLKVFSPGRILWLNVTGSGNETAAHLAVDPRMTLMWCSFGSRALILRAYGSARAVHRGDPDWSDLAAQLPDLPGGRQIIDMSVDLVQTSCGYAVPFMNFREDRPVLKDWAEAKGLEGLRTYWDERNRHTIDGLPTGIEANL
jgi:Pyridoxamine 5'-phosphate oxidase